MNPHLHVLLHLPNAKLREELQAALTAVYGYTHSGGLVAKVVAGTDRRIRHESGYWGSTFDYITRHKTQQAYRARGGSTWRASRRDENGRHRGIKCPFVGRRWNVSRNINAKARQAQRDGAAMIAARAAQRIAAGAIVRRMSDADIGKGLSGVPPYPTGEVLQQTIECRCNVRRGRNCDRVGEGANVRCVFSSRPRTLAWSLAASGSLMSSHESSVLHLRRFIVVRPIPRGSPAPSSSFSHGALICRTEYAVSPQRCAIC